MHNKLKKRIAYEKMLAEISERAVRVYNINLFLNDSLRKIGTILDVSRLFIFNYISSGNNYRCICRWDASDLAPPGKIDTHHFSLPWATQQFLMGKVINFANVKKMPDENYRNWLVSIKVKSTLNVPLFIHGNFYGFMGFDECRRHREWIDEDIYILTTAAQIITRAIENKNYEEELKQQRNRLRSIFSSVQDAIITVDTSMRVLEANNAAEKICGLKIILGKPFEMCTNGCDQSCTKILKTTLKTKQAVPERQLECRHTEAGRMVAMVTCSPLQDGSGSFMGAVLVIRDVTRLKFLEETLKGNQKYNELIGKSRKIKKIYGLLEKLAPLNTTVLITGESGTGKEMIARTLHKISSRADKPFVAVNCSALPEQLLENELFGHVKGAFTGAEKDAAGRFQAADGGTLLLDEIGDISPMIQIKLLRVLQEKVFERLGESKPIEFDVRVITATNCDLKKAIKAGTFREDLYYRLNVINIEIPPLRERSEDIPLLMDHFRKHFNKSYKMDIKGFSSGASVIFQTYPWPGNIRELKHAVESAFVLCQERIIRSDHLPVSIKELKSENNNSPVLNPKADDTNEIINTLEKTDWNIAKTARALGVSRWTIYRRMKQFNITKI